MLMVNVDNKFKTDIETSSGAFGFSFIFFRGRSFFGEEVIEHHVSDLFYETLIFLFFLIRIPSHCSLESRMNRVRFSCFEDVFKPFYC